MAIKFYIFLSILYFLLGLISIINIKYKNDALRIFLILTAVLPITKFTTYFHIRSQISIYYFFFIGVCLISFLKLLSVNKIKSNLFQGLFLLGSFFCFYLLHYFFIVNDDRDVIDVFKDIKPLVIIVIAYLFIDYYKERLKEILTNKFCDNIILLNFLFSTVFFYLMIKNDIHLSLTNDPYYKYEELRYENLGTYFGLFYFFKLIINSQRPSLRQFFLIITPLFYTGNRTLIFASLTIIALYYFSKTSFKKIFSFF